LCGRDGGVGLDGCCHGRCRGPCRGSTNREFFEKNTLDVGLGIRKKLFIESIKDMRLNTIKVLTACGLLDGQAFQVYSEPACQQSAILIKKNAAFILVDVRRNFQRQLATTGPKSKYQLLAAIAEPSTFRAFSRSSSLD
jgi:hypothetical protein